MSLKVSFGVIPCPDCGELIMHHDFELTGFCLAKCEGCGKEWEIRKCPSGKTIEIKPKMIN
ncbi:MAG: hypothetical protein WBC70_07140 [Candidatus Aminicenantales bacterium]